MKFPILIIGLGPAGASAAIFLAQAGFDVVAMDRKFPQAYTVGESLPPHAVHVLQQLGVWQTFQADHHLKCYGNQSAWGSDKLHHTDFILQPPGYGWHIDRTAFEAMLRAKAGSSGAILKAPARVLKADYQDGTWAVEWKDDSETMHQQKFSFIVDASGRNSWLARKMKIERLHLDRQLALIAFLKVTNPDFQQNRSLIETTPEGWWYSALIPDRVMATAFLCNPSSEERKSMANSAAWWQLLSRSNHSIKRIQESNAELITTPQFVSAESFRLENIQGPGWVAIGDAALCYDPISSHGVLMAMLSAREGAAAIKKQLLDGDNHSLIQFQELMFHSYGEYLRQRQEFYQAERRFADSVYWKNRMSG
jgi:2-polyprenyl-6-methoxyphenol hydroxylase-like FAD-dependent oxidoreductase